MVNMNSEAVEFEIARLRKLCDEYGERMAHKNKQISELERRLERARVKIAHTETSRDDWKGIVSMRDSDIADLENRLGACTEARLAETIRDLPKIKALTDAMGEFLEGFVSDSMEDEVNARDALFEAYDIYMTDE